MPERALSLTIVKMENQTMKLKNLLMNGAMLAMLGFVVVGCNENTIVDPPPSGTKPQPVSGLQATSTGPTSVGLKWTKSPSDTGTANITYNVKASSTLDSVSINNLPKGTTTSSVTGLVIGRRYTFSVSAVNGTEVSTSTTIDWAGAIRMDGTTNFRMYEANSTFGSGLGIDPVTGTVSNVSVKAGSPGKATLALYLDPKTGGNPNKVIIGPAYAITEYKAAANNDFNKIDSSVYISDSTYLVTSLDSWYSSKSINNYISANGNVKAFELTPSQATSAQGFYMRIGPSGNYRYARVFIKKGASGIVQGTFPDRYVEMSVSFQLTPDLPFAKPGMSAPRGFVASTTGH